jgi:hypothetical protein
MAVGLSHRTQPLIRRPVLLLFSVAPARPASACWAARTSQVLTETLLAAGGLVDLALAGLRKAERDAGGAAVVIRHGR